MSPTESKADSSTPRFDAATIVARSLWGLLALIHVWPMAAVSIALVADPSPKGVASLLILVGLVSLSTVKAMGSRLLRSDRPRTELLVWVLAGGMLHGGDLWPVEKMEFVPVAAGAGIGGGLMARRENRRRLATLVRDLFDGFLVGARSIWSPQPVLGTLAEAPVVHRTRWSCQRRTMRPPPARD